MNAFGRCELCGRSVSLGAQCVCLTSGFTEQVHPHRPPFTADDRIAAALERIAAALERIAPAHVEVRLNEAQILAALDCRHAQQPPPTGPLPHTHGPTES